MKNKNPLTVALDIANDLKLDKLTLKEIELLQVPKVKELSPSQIRRIREKENASQGVFAQLLNVSSSTIQKWERGEVRPQNCALKLLNLAHKYGLGAIKG